MTYIANESKFAQLNKELKLYYSIADYKKAMLLIEQAMKICKELYIQSFSLDQKEKWKQNALELKKQYKDCSEKLGHVVDLETSVSTKQKPKPKKDDSDHVVNGVDIRPLMIIEANENIDFSDVCGMDKEKRIIESEFFATEEEQAFKDYLSIKRKSFILLYGPPGTGKTFFAKAISNEFKKRLSGEDVYFFAVKSSNLKDSKVGQTEKNIQAIFDYCSKFKRVVLFFDEFESIVPDRTKESGDPTAKSTVDTFLQAINGFSSNKNTLLIAATNYPNQMDRAVLDRVDKRIEVPLPNEQMISQMLDKSIGKFISEDVSLPLVAKKLKGFSARGINRFCEETKNLLSESFNENKGKAFSEYKITSFMIEKAFRNIDQLN